ncbi:MAG: FGGY family carbohydrate kinase [Kibdelosporangium sp.]
MTGLVLAIDLGSSAAKAGLVDRRGQVVAKASASMPVVDGAIREADPEAWWSAAVEAIRAATAEATDGIETVVVCGFMHTLVGLDDRGAVVAPAVLMGDTRTEPAESAAADCVRRVEAWQGRDPAAAARVRTYLTPKDFLRFRLTGERATDLYDAGGAGLLTMTAAPPVLEPGAIAGKVSQEAAVLLGLRAGTPVLTGSGDWLANLVGTAAALPGRLCLYLGTSAALGAFPSPAGLAALHEPKCVAAAADSGRAVERALRMLYPHHRDPFMAATKALRQSPIGARGVTFLPYLGGSRPGQTGRRSGSLSGLGLDTSRDDLARSILEGLAFWIRDLAEGHRAQEIVLCGGGGRSPAWADLLADVLATTVIAPVETDAGLVGLARIADPGIPPVSGSPVRIAEPDAGRVISYRTAYRAFAELNRVSPGL